MRFMVSMSAVPQNSKHTMRPMSVALVIWSLLLKPDPYQKLSPGLWLISSSGLLKFKLLRSTGLE